VVTCWHVTQDRKSDESIVVMFPKTLTVQVGDTTIQQVVWKNIEGTLLMEDRNIELAIIELGEEPDCQPLMLSNEDKFEEGTVLSLQGYGGSKYKQLWGKVAEKMLINRKGEIIWHQLEGASSVSGDSGGPILDIDGKYAGTLWGSDGKITGFLNAVLVREEVLKIGKEVNDIVVPPLDIHIYQPRDGILPEGFSRRPKQF